MALMDKAQLKEFIKANNIKTTDDIQTVLRDLTLQEMLEAELDDDLDYTKHDDTGKQTENRRNGHSPKTVRSEYGDMELAVPRDRDGEFEPAVVRKYQKNVAGIEEHILALYAKGVSTESQTADPGRQPAFRRIDLYLRFGRGNTTKTTSAIFNNSMIFFANKENHAIIKKNMLSILVSA